jgi:hypothetical protein
MDQPKPQNPGNRRCDTCEYSEIKLEADGFKRFCLHSPPQVVPILGSHPKTHQPVELGLWTGVPLVKDDGFCYQHSLSLAKSMVGSRNPPLQGPLLDITKVK